MAASHQVSQWPLHLITRYSRARQMRHGEIIPLTLISGFENMRIDPDWIWVCDSADGVPEAILMASPVHGAACLWRLAALETASNFSIPRLLRRALCDMHNRGIAGYICLLDPDRPIEKRLMSIIAKAGGIQFGKGLVFAGATNFEQLRLG